VGEPLYPSGRQLEITHGEQRAVVVTVGGGLRSYDVSGVPVLDGYDVEAMCDGARGQTLVPWPNRVKDGKWSWQGDDLQLSLTEPEQHNAIHGLVRWLPWHVLDHQESVLSLGCASYPQPGYPWPFDVTTTYTLDDSGLTVETAITNQGTSSAPVAAGAHPYITVGTARIDDAILHLPARTWIQTGDQQIPTGRESVEGSPYDFRVPRAIGDVEIDYTFTDLHRDDDNRFRLRLEAPDGSRAVTFWVGPAYDFVELFTGDALPDKSRRREGLGVEPMTAPPNAFASGDSLVVLAPGERWSGEWGITPQ
jgi:aldose 1-epimerase